MKKLKKTAVIVFLLISIISFLPLIKSNAHTVELDTEGIINFPSYIYGGGTISIRNEKDYSLYHQIIQLSSDIESKINDSNKEIESMNKEIKDMEDDTKKIFDQADEAYKIYNEKFSSGEATEEELEELKQKADELAKKYEEKFAEYNTKHENLLKRYNEIITEINKNIPEYTESNWIETTDGKFEIDVSAFSGEKAFVIWAKLVKSDNSVVYDTQIYSLEGTKPVEVETITLEKTELSLTEGEEYTLTATIKPENANNKTITWKSDNEAIATVVDGKIKAIAEGKAIITVATSDGKVTSTCEVTVNKKVVTEEPKQEEAPKQEKLPEVIPDTGSKSIVYISIIAVLAIIGIITYKKVKNLNFK